MARHYGVSLATVGLLTSILFFAELAAMMPLGRLIDRVGPRPVSIAGLVLAGSANIPLVAGGGFGSALLLRALVGVGAAAGFLGGAAYVQRTTGSALAQGIYGATGLASGGIVLAAVPALSGELGWRAPWLLALGGTVACILLALTGPSTTPLPDAPGRAGRSMLRISLSPVVARLGTVHAASFGFSIVIGNWSVVLLEHAGHGRGFAGYAGALTLLGGVIGRPAGGWLARSRPHTLRATLMGGIALGASGALVLAAAPAPAPVALLGAALVGIGGGLPFGIVLWHAARTVPDAHGLALAAMNSYALGAVIVATPLLGLTFSLPGAGRTGFAMAAILCLMTLGVVPGIPRTGSGEGAVDPNRSALPE